jgi:CubicO group peptidase (beta-lactamase class C family)
MILIEECRIRLDDPIDDWLPELANRTVLRSISSPLDDTVPANRSITVRDLLTFRLGFGSVMAPPDTFPIQTAIRELQIGGDGPPLPATAPDGDEWLRRLGSLPLIAQPGERWLYNTGSDVLGLLIARVSGQSFGTFLHERIFAPLGMCDTGFSVPAEKIDRLSVSYGLNPETQTLDIFDDQPASAWAAEPLHESGSGGLVSTVEDYHAFQRMLLDHGRCTQGQIISRASVDLMTSDQLTPEQRAGAEIFFGDFSSWGFGMAVDIRRADFFIRPGRFGWTGGLGTTAYADPEGQMTGILFTQRMMDSPKPPSVFLDFWTLAYSSIV